MKTTELIKAVIRYQWYDVLFDRFYKREYVDLPVNDLWQDVARRITFGWGLSAGGGIGIILFVLSLRFAEGLLLIPIILLLTALAFFLSSAASTVYLFFRMRRHYKDEAHRLKMEAEGYGELHGELDEAPSESSDD